MKKRNKYLVVILVLLLLGNNIRLGWIIYSKQIEENRLISYEEAGTDFTKVFNDKRVILNLPIIPEDWISIDSLHYKIQTWENPDTIIPNYSEKTVVADTKAQFLREIDRYTLKRQNNYDYQLVIEFDYQKLTRICTIRNTYRPTENGLRYAGDVVGTISIDQAEDTLKFYGLNRLNYQ